MNTTDDNLPAKLNIHIVSFGATGNAAAALLAQDGQQYARCTAVYRKQLLFDFPDNSM